MHLPNRSKFNFGVGKAVESERNDAGMRGGNRGRRLLLGDGNRGGDEAGNRDGDEAGNRCFGRLVGGDGNSNGAGAA